MRKLGLHSNRDTEPDPILMAAEEVLASHLGTHKFLMGFEINRKSLIEPFCKINRAGLIMSIITRISTAFFTALPGSLFFLLVISSNMHKEYYWPSILTGVSVLFGSALLLGFTQSPRVRPKWIWIIAAGFAAMTLALLAISLINATPLCVGQDNGDGNNDFGRCMGYVMLYAIFYGIPYMILVTASAVAGHWVTKVFRNL